MSSLNYSEQFSSLFLLNDSGNSLATELGEVASLEEMEELSDSVNSCIRAKATEVQNLEESLAESDKKIEAVSNLPYELESKDSELLKMMAEYKEREEELNTLKNTCDTLTRKKDLTYLKDTLDSLEPEADLFNEDAYLAELIHISTKLKELPPIPQSILESLECDINMSDFEMEDVGELENMVDNIRNIDIENEKDTRELDEINKQLSEFKVCPYCSSDLKENHVCQS
jgi:DNA repair exonuclease SbcCD ATPase subunit